MILLRCMMMMILLQTVLSSNKFINIGCHPDNPSIEETTTSHKLGLHECSDKCGKTGSSYMVHHGELDCTCSFMVKNDKDGHPCEHDSFHLFRRVDVKTRGSESISIVEECTEDLCCPMYNGKKPSIEPIKFIMEGEKIQEIIKSESDRESFCEVNGEELNIFASYYMNSSVEKLGLDNSGLESGPSNKRCEDLKRFIPEECLPHDWRITKVLGGGNFGHVFATKGPNGESGALKLQMEQPFVYLDSETHMTNLFHELNLSPGIKNQCSYDIESGNVLVIHMGRIDMTVKTYLETDPSVGHVDLLVSKIMEAILRIENNGYRHGDFHIGNVGFTIGEDGKTGILQVIDMGTSSYKGAYPSVEIIALLQGNFWEDKIDNVEFDKSLRKQAMAIYGHDFPVGIQELTTLRTWWWSMIPKSAVKILRNTGRCHEKNGPE